MAFASRVRSVGVEQLVADAVAGHFEHVLEEAEHLVGSWLAEMVLTSQLEARTTGGDSIAEGRGRSGNLLLNRIQHGSNAVMHGFVWHSLARVPPDEFVANAAELCSFGNVDDILEDCQHGAGHGALLNVLLRSGISANLGACYSACTPPRQFNRFPLQRSHVIEALSLCAPFAAAIRQSHKECNDGLFHFAIYLLQPMDIAGLAWLCALRPEGAGPIYPAMPQFDACWVRCWLLIPLPGMLLAPKFAHVLSPSPRCSTPACA